MDTAFFIRYPRGTLSFAEAMQSSERTKEEMFPMNKQTNLFLGITRTVALAVVTAFLSLSFVRPAAAADILSAFEEKRVLSDTLSGKLSKVSFATPALGGQRGLYIYTPPGYSPTAPKPYPVMIMLHGTPGGPLDWLYKGGAHRTLDNAIKSGQFPACVMVVADGRGPFYKGGSEWADSIDGRCKMETSMTVDLPRFLQSHYRVSRDPAQWTLVGLSAGGYGAANLVVRHPDIFRNAVVLSGDYVVSDDWGDATQVFGNDPMNRQRNSPLEHLRSLEPATRQSLRFYVAVGADDDSDLIAQNESFIATCKALGVPVRFDNDKGNHKWGFWSGHFKSALDPLAGWLKEAGQS